MKRLLWLPAAASLLAGPAVIGLLCLFPRPVKIEPFLGVPFFLTAACAVAYLAAKRPWMWGHLGWYFISLLVTCLATSSAPPGSMESMINVVLFGLLYLPALPVCALYQVVWLCKAGSKQSERIDDGANGDDSLE